MKKSVWLFMTVIAVHLSASAESESVVTGFDDFSEGSAEVVVGIPVSQTSDSTDLSDPVPSIRDLLATVDFAPQAKNDSEKCPLGKIHDLGENLHIFSKTEKGMFSGKEDYFSVVNFGQHSDIDGLSKTLGPFKCHNYSLNTVTDSAEVLEVRNTITKDCTIVDPGSQSKINSDESHLTVTKAGDFLKMEIEYKRNNVLTYSCSYLGEIK